MRNDPAQFRTMYRRALMALRDSEIPFLIGGAYALGLHTQIHRETKDLDLFTRPRHCADMLKLFADLGYPSRMVARHWLGKVSWEGAVIDIITGFRNGVNKVEDSWFDHAHDAVLFDTPVRILAPEEMIWSKAFVMERDRYDGADIVHLIRAHADGMDWRRLIDRFGPHWLLLLNHLVTFSFVYPSERHRLPEWVVRELSERWTSQNSASGAEICQGTLLSHTQYCHDLERLGLLDARIKPIGTLTQENINE
ncbi:MAG TPA: hypothetical protein VNM14_02165 [Planctomycetota bacterium]|nr:hypothetical protein [Planctomycetota bacterium]